MVIEEPKKKRRSEDNLKGKLQVSARPPLMHIIIIFLKIDCDSNKLNMTKTINELKKATAHSSRTKRSFFILFFSYTRG